MTALDKTEREAVTEARRCHGKRRDTSAVYSVIFRNRSSLRRLARSHLSSASAKSRKKPTSMAFVSLVKPQRLKTSTMRLPDAMTRVLSGDLNIL